MPSDSSTSASVVDTTPPEIACNAPATLRPRDAVISFSATASDTCDDEVAAEVTAYDCYTFTTKERRVSKLDSCIVSFAGDTLTIHDVGGVGNNVAWTVEAEDDSGNVGRTSCELLVVR
jgi:hypothetical protein